MEINSIKTKINHIPIKLLFFLAPFTVSGLFQNITPFIETSLALQLIAFLYFFLFMLKHKKIVLKRFETYILMIFITPVLLSFIGVLSKVLFDPNAFYYEYIDADFKNRLILIVFNLTILVGLLTITHNWTREKTNNLIKKYYNGLFLFTVIGVWQFFHFLIGVPFINVETRSHIHSVSKNLLFINNRLTSLANEPSYLAPLVIDFIILSFLLTKKPKVPVIIGLFVLIFSYSGGGYLNLFLLTFVFLVTYLKYKGYRFNRKSSFKVLLIFFAFGGVLLKYNSNLYYLVMPVIGRMESFFDLNNHVRIFMVVMPFAWAAGGNILNFLFGYGPSSYKYLNLTERLPTGQAVHVTSNNLFSDTVYEAGYLGLIMYTGLFVKLIYTPFKKVYHNKDYFFATMLSTHLFITSIYRADYMQIRFWILIFIIFKLMRFAEMKDFRVGGESI